MMGENTCKNDKNDLKTYIPVMKILAQTLSGLILSPNCVSVLSPPSHGLQMENTSGQCYSTLIMQTCRPLILSGNWP